jgi:hypothetical protein
MSDAPKRSRSFERINKADLAHLAHLALRNLHGLFARKPHSAVYDGRLMLLCLCQGAAQHYVHRDRGVNDFDVWAFFRSYPKYSFPYRRHGTADFGPSRFGHNAREGSRFIGRRVDIMGRSVPVLDSDTAITALCRYLREGAAGSSACHLAQRPVVVIWPEALCGQVIWEGT